MRGKEAKRLRQLTGFHPADKLEYRHLGNRPSFSNGTMLPGTITAIGERELYQDMKKAVRHA